MHEAATRRAEGPTGTARRQLLQSSVPTGPGVGLMSSSGHPAPSRSVALTPHSGQKEYAVPDSLASTCPHPCWRR